jgi:DNA-binding response OmpR family regulator
MAAMPASLIIIRGAHEGERFVLEKCPCTIGRDAECLLTLDAPGISRLHARIDRSYGQYTVTDEGSTNGTFVNGERVQDEVLLTDGDEIQFASSVVVRFDDPAATDQVDLRALSFEGVQVDETRAEVFVNGQLVDPPLSPSQYALLAALVRREDEIVTREEIAGAVWPDEAHITDQMIDTLVSRLRKRLARYDADHYIVTRRGFGLMFSRDA